MLARPLTPVLGRPVAVVPLPLALPVTVEVEEVEVVEALLPLSPWRRRVAVVGDDGFDVVSGWECGVSEEELRGLAWMGRRVDLLLPVALPPLNCRRAVSGDRRWMPYWRNSESLDG